MSGCATAPLNRAGTLASYDDLAPSDNLVTHSQLRVSKEDVLAAKTVRIAPTTYAGAAAEVPLSETQRKLLATVVDRSLCIGLSDRLEIVPASEPADLTVRAVVTHIGLTDPGAAGVSKAASIAASILVPVPGPKPRIPIGMGGLSIEAEARSANGEQKAAMIWARGANAFISQPRVSEVGDAYDLATSFGDDFSKLMVTGTDPFKGLPAPPSLQKINSFLGGAYKNPACEAFGRSPGVLGMVGGGLALPPEWTDKGAPAPADGATTGNQEPAR